MIDFNVVAPLFSTAPRSLDEMHGELIELAYAILPDSRRILTTLVTSGVCNTERELIDDMELVIELRDGEYELVDDVEIDDRPTLEISLDEMEAA